jgi:hypothetical protein
MPDINGCALYRFPLCIENLTKQSCVVCIFLELPDYRRSVGLDGNTVAVEGTKNGGVGGFVGGNLLIFICCLRGALEC